uniref:Uncharacterized protein n=1 Tax=Arundo donax TaxID=35708 RepID=A0A0A8YJL5_ARUDO
MRLNIFKGMCISKETRQNQQHIYMLFSKSKF